MYKRNFFRATILTFTATVGLLFASSAAIATGDCNPIAPGTCWQFEFYKLEVVADYPVFDESGFEKWQYQITRNNQSRFKTDGPTIDVIFMLGADVEVDKEGLTDAVWFPELCEGDIVNNVGVGDCYRKVVRWESSKDGSSLLNLYVDPQGYSETTLPVYVVVDNEKYDIGTIIGPLGVGEEAVEAFLATTNIIDKTSDGRALAINTDLYGGLVSILSCADVCDDYPVNFSPLTEEDAFDLEEAYFCIPGGDSSSIFPVNSTLTVDLAELSDLHCGHVEFKDEASRIQFSNRGTCRVVYGKLRCW